MHKYAPCTSCKTGDASKLHFTCVAFNRYAESTLTTQVSQYKISITMDYLLFYTFQLLHTNENAFRLAISTTFTPYLRHCRSPIVLTPAIPQCDMAKICVEFRAAEVVNLLRWCGSIVLHVT